MILNKTKKIVKPTLPTIHIYGDKILARPYKDNDKDAWIKVREENKDFLQPYEPLWPANSFTPKFYHSMLTQIMHDWAADRRYCFLIFTKEQSKQDSDGIKEDTPAPTSNRTADQFTKLVGGININNVQRGVTQFASFGYWLAENEQGNGYMTDALRGMINFSFTVLKLNRVHISCMPHNTPSINIAKRLHFDEEGFAKKYIKINGVWEDHVLFGLTRDDWISRSQDI